MQRVEAALRTGTAQTVTPGSPIDYFANLEEYTLVCYRPGRGPVERPWKWPWQGRSWTASCAPMWRLTASAAPPREDLTGLLTDYAGQDWSALMSDYLDTRMN